MRVSSGFSRRPGPTYLESFIFRCSQLLVNGTPSSKSEGPHKDSIFTLEYEWNTLSPISVTISTTLVLEMRFYCFRRLPGGRDILLDLLWRLEVRSIFSAPSRVLELPRTHGPHGLDGSPQTAQVQKHRRSRTTLFQFQLEAAGIRLINDDGRSKPTAKVARINSHLITVPGRQQFG